MRKLLLIATLSIFTALSLTACSEQDVDKAVQKVGDVIEDNKISQEQLDSAEDTFNNVMDKTSKIVGEAKDSILEEVEESTEEVEESTEEENTVEGENSSADADNAQAPAGGVKIILDLTSNPDLKSSNEGNTGSVGFDVEKANRVSAGNANDDNNDVTFASGNDAVSDDKNEIDEPTVLAANNSEFNTKDLYYRTNCMEDVEEYIAVVRQSEIDSLNSTDNHMGIDIRKIAANDAYLHALSVLSKIDFDDISVSFKLNNEYNKGEEEFTKALVEILSNM